MQATPDSTVISTTDKTIAGDGLQSDVGLVLKGNRGDDHRKCILQLSYQLSPRDLSIVDGTASLQES